MDVLVEHPDWGSGRLLSRPLAPGSGLPVVGRFATGFQAVSRESLRGLEGEVWPGLPARLSGEALSSAQRSASRWLEALRLGTVACGEDDWLTVGRTAEWQTLESDLRRTAEQGGACRVLTGAYGVGKSHLLRQLARRAGAEGFAVSSLVLDRSRVTPSRPRRLYRELLAGLRLPGGQGESWLALEAVLERVAWETERASAEAPWQEHLFLSPVLRLWGRLSPKSRADLLYWVAGGERRSAAALRVSLRREAGRDPGPLYALKDHRTVWNQLTYLLTGWACLLRESGLARGWVVILDEAEMSAVESRREQRFGERTLAGLAAAALGPRRVGRPDLLRELGGHQATRHHPPFYRGQSHLGLALGLAHSPAGLELLRGILPSDAFCELAPLQSADLERLLGRILETYRVAFPHVSWGPGFAKPLARLLEQRTPSQGNPRRVVQQAMAFLDGARLWPGSMESFVERCWESA